MYMPLMVDIRRAVVFAGDRDEGLQKTQKLACFADDLLVVCEEAPRMTEIVLTPGRPSLVKENLTLKVERRIPVHPVRAAEADLASLIAGASFVTSDLTDRGLNQRIYEVANQYHVLCNIIDTKDLCNSWFMSLIETDHLVAGLSTKATATYYVTRLRKTLEPKFRLWEREAAFTATLRSLVPADRRLSGLQKLWADPWIRLALRWLGPGPALTLAKRRLKKENSL